MTLLDALDKGGKRVRRTSWHYPTSYVYVGMNGYLWWRTDYVGQGQKGDHSIFAVTIESLKATDWEPYIGK